VPNPTQKKIKPTRRKQKRQKKNTLTAKRQRCEVPAAPGKNQCMHKPISHLTPTEPQEERAEPSQGFWALREEHEELLFVHGAAVATPIPAQLDLCHLPKQAQPLPHLHALVPLHAPQHAHVLGVGILDRFSSHLIPSLHPEGQLKKRK